MENRKVHIDNLYREKQEEFASLPEAAWSDMEKILDKSPGKSGSGRWMWYGLLVLLVGLVSYYGLRSSDIFNRESIQKDGVGHSSYHEGAGTDINNTQATKNGQSKEGSLQNEEVISERNNIPKGKPENFVPIVNTNGSSSEGQSGSTSALKNIGPRSGKTVRAADKDANNQHRRGQTNDEAAWTSVTSVTVTTAKSTSGSKNNTIEKQSGDPEKAEPAPVKSTSDNAKKNGSSSQGKNIVDVGKTEQKSNVVDQGLSDSEPETNSKPGGTTQKIVSGQQPAGTGSQSEGLMPTKLSTAHAKNKESGNPKGTKNEITELSQQGSNTSVRTKTQFQKADAISKEKNQGVIAAYENGETLKPATASSEEPSGVKAATAKSKVSTNPERKPGTAQVIQRENGMPAREDKSIPISEREGQDADETKIIKEGDNSSDPATVSTYSSSGKSNADGKNKRKKETNGKPYKFEFGVKGGYEIGVSQMPANKTIVGPFLQYSLSDKLFVNFSPSLKSGNLKKLTTPQQESSFYLPSGTTEIGSGLIPRQGMLVPYTIYQHSYDSIVISYQSSSKILDFELPVTLGYRITNSFSVLGGISVTKGKLASVTEQKKVFNLLLTDTLIQSNSPALPGKDTSFIHTAMPYSSYIPVGSSAAANPLRFGYMVGLNYSRRYWLLELTLQQTFSGLSDIQNADIKKAYSQPYIRMTVGLKMGK